LVIYTTQGVVGDENDPPPLTWLIALQQCITVLATLITSLRHYKASP